MNQNQKNMLKELYNNLVMAFNEQDLGDCADSLQKILQNEREFFENIPQDMRESQEAKESQKVIDNLEKANDAVLEVLSEFEEYEISGFFAAVRGNNSSLRALFKENVQFASNCIAEILH